MEQLSAGRQAMMNRRRVTFGPAYIRDVIDGVQRDFQKQIVHAVQLGLGTEKRLSKMEPTELRAMLAQKLKEAKKRKQELPRNAYLS